MKKFTKKILNNLSIFLLIYLIAGVTLLKAEKYEVINITGNKRLSVETILMFSGLKTGIDLNINDLNIAIKKLYETDYFKNIEIEIIDNEIEIKILENPIIQTIDIKGIKNKRIIRQLKEITKKSEKYPFLINNVQDQKNQLLNITRSSGFYFSDIEVKIINNIN